MHMTEHGLSCGITYNSVMNGVILEWCHPDVSIIFVRLSRHNVCGEVNVYSVKIGKK